MASSANSWRYAPNLSDAVQEKINLLFTFQSTIESLEAQLESVRREHTLLDAYLEPYRIPSSPALPLSNRCASETSSQFISPIHSCPDEILYMIIEQCLIPRHRRIGILLQVCKQWNNMLTRSSKLWAKIQVLGGGLDFFKDTSRDSAHSYISACIKRSGDLLLDVELNLDMLPDQSDYIRGELEERAIAIISDDDQEAITDRIAEIYWDYDSPKYESMLAQFIECILGKDGCHMQRWAILDLSLPEKHVPAKTIWAKLVCPVPNLRKLNIWSISIGPSSEDYPPNNSLKDLSPLQSLKFGHECGPIPLHFFHLSPQNLVHLELAFDRRLLNLEALSFFPRLRGLKLVGMDGMHNSYRHRNWKPPPTSSWPIYTIRLPQLVELTLSGEYVPLNSLEFDLPLLHHFTVCTKSLFYSPPRIHSQRLSWQLTQNDRRPWAPAVTFMAISCLVSLPATILVIPESVRKVAIEETWIGEEQGTCPPSKEIYAEDNDGHLERIDDEQVKRLLRIARQNSFRFSK